MNGPSAEDPKGNRNAWTDIRPRLDERPGAALMSVDDRGVDHQVFSVTAVMRGDGRIDQIGAQHV